MKIVKQMLMHHCILCKKTDTRRAYSDLLVFTLSGFSEN